MLETTAVIVIVGFAVCFISRAIARSFRGAGKDGCCGECPDCSCAAGRSSRKKGKEEKG